MSFESGLNTNPAEETEITTPEKSKHEGLSDEEKERREAMDYLQQESHGADIAGRFNYKEIWSEVYSKTSDRLMAIGMGKEKAEPGEVERLKKKLARMLRIAELFGF